jgi:hypothetical protein
MGRLHRTDELSSVSAALFVDGAALTIELRRRGCSVDLTGLVRWAESVAGPLAIRYWFDATVDGTPNAFHNAAARAGGFRLKVHPQIPRMMCGTDGRQITAMKQVGVDVGLAIQVLRSLDRDGWDTLVLVAGDGDFYPLAEDLVERRGVRLIVLGAPEASSGMLTSYASKAYPVSTVLSEISRSPLRVAL